MDELIYRIPTRLRYHLSIHSMRVNSDALLRCCSLFISVIKYHFYTHHTFWVICLYLYERCGRKVQFRNFLYFDLFSLKYTHYLIDY